MLMTDWWQMIKNQNELVETHISKVAIVQQ